MSNASSTPTVRLSAPTVPFKYGTFQGGAHLIPAAWGTAIHRFEVDPGLRKAAAQVPNRPTAVDFSGPLAEAPRSPLSRFPVDVFVADHSRDSHESKQPVWCQWLNDCPGPDRPDAIVQVWPSFTWTRTLVPWRSRTGNSSEIMDTRCRSIL